MNMKCWPAAGLMLGLLALAGTLSAAGGSIELGVKGRGNATPTIAAEGSFVAVAWGGTEKSGATDVFLAVSRDGGRSFGAPVRVNNVEGDARLNGEQPPHVALVPRAGHDPAIVVVWTTKGTAGTKLLQTRSNDGGKSFPAAPPVPGTEAPGNRGWQAIAVEPGGRVDAVWLDHREMASDSSMAASHHDHAGSKPDGVAMAQKSKLFFASLDGATAPHAVTGGVCYCCKTALVGGAGGSIYAAWRHVYPGNLRDMAFTQSRDGGRTFTPPVRISEDKWMLEGCPDDGPSMTVDATKRIHVVWPTLVSGEGKDAEPTIALFYATSTDGRQFTARQRIPAEGVPHHPRIAVNAAGALTVVWDESAAGTRRIAMAQAAANPGAPPQFRRQALTNGGAAIYPAIAVTADAVVTAWTSGASESASIQVTRFAASSSSVTDR